MILVSRDEILSRFAGIPAVILHPVILHPVISCKTFHPSKTDPSFAQSGSRFAGTKFSHVTASTRLGGIKKLIKNINRSTFQ